jgi:hypothetical protein
MDLKPVVFALILGWVTGDEQLNPALLQWLQTGRTPADSRRITCADPVVGDLVLHQVRLDNEPVRFAEP